MIVPNATSRNGVSSPTACTSNGWKARDLMSADAARNTHEWLVTSDDIGCICESPLRHHDHGHFLELARTLSGGPRKRDRKEMLISVVVATTGQTIKTTTYVI